MAGLKERGGSALTGLRGRGARCHRMSCGPIASGEVGAAGPAGSGRTREAGMGLPEPPGLSLTCPCPGIAEHRGSVPHFAPQLRYSPRTEEGEMFVLGPAFRSL